MDFLLDALTKWLKEMLVGGIIDVYKRQDLQPLLLCEHTGYLGRTIPGKTEVVYLLDYGCSFLVNNEIFILVHEVAIHRLACDGLAIHAF